MSAMRTGVLEPRPRVLLVDDESAIRNGLGTVMGRHVQVHTATDGVSALRAVEEHGPFAVIVADLRMPGMNGLMLLDRAREVAPETARLVLVGYLDRDAAVAARGDGRVFGYVVKPCVPGDLVASVAAAVEHHRTTAAMHART